VEADAHDGSIRGGGPVGGKCATFVNLCRQLLDVCRAVCRRSTSAERLCLCVAPRCRP